MHKDADRVWIAAEHDIAEPHIIIRCNMAGGNASERILWVDGGKKDEILAPTLRRRAHFLVELDILDNFKGEGEIAEQDVYAQEPNQAEVAQHVVERQ